MLHKQMQSTFEKHIIFTQKKIFFSALFLAACISRYKSYVCSLTKNTKNNPSQKLLRFFIAYIIFSKFHFHFFSIVFYILKTDVTHFYKKARKNFIILEKQSFFVALGGCRDKMSLPLKRTRSL